MEYKLRDYQENAVDVAVSYFQSTKDKNAFMVLPTGSGKSLVIAAIARELKEPTIIFQPSKEILEQNFAKLHSYGIWDASVYSASLNSKEVSRITFATIGSVVNRPGLFKHFKNVLIDECFPYGQYVSTSIGKRKIGTLYNWHTRGEQLPNVLSFNEKENKIEESKIVEIRCNGRKKLINLSFSGNTKVRVTKNHPFLTGQGWIMADELNVGDVVLTTNINGRGYFRIPNNDQIELINGGILGDGNIDKLRKKKNVNRFRFIQGANQKEYLDWKANILHGKVRKIKENGYSKKVAFAFNSPSIIFYDNLCNRKSAIKNLSLKSLAVAWMDDGTLYKKENGGRLYSTAESYSETLYFRDRLKDFGIKSIVKKSNSSSSGKEYYYLVFDKKNIEVLCYMIAPFIHKSMKYKIVQDSWKYVGAYKWDAAYSKFGGAVVESVFNCESDIVYNMEVEGNHTYVITSGRYEKSHKTFNDGIIVHNCHYVNAQKGMYKNFLDNLNGSKVLGLTATPYRLSSNSMGSQLKFLSRTRPRVFDELIYFVQTSVLAKRGYLSKMKYYEVKGVDVSMLKSNSTGADYTDKSLKQHYLSIGFNGLILNVIDRLLAVNRKSILVFTKFIDEAKFVADRCPDAEIVTGSTKKRDRERILNDFKSGKIKVILNVGVLTTGFDFPELETVVLARPTKSLGLYYQMVGRGIRPHPNKPETWVVDLCQNYRRFGRVEDLKISAIKNKLWHVESKGKILTNRILQ